MKLSESVKPVSYVKAHISDILRDVVAEHKTLYITQNGEARAVLQDLKTYEQTQESLAMLKIVAQGNKSLADGKVKPLKKSVADLRKRIDSL